MSLHYYSSEPSGISPAGRTRHSTPMMVSVGFMEVVLVPKIHVNTNLQNWNWTFRFLELQTTFSVNGCLVNHFPCKNLESSNWNNIHKGMFQVPAQIHLYLFPYRITHISLENLRCKAIFVHTKNIQGVSIDVSPREVDQPPTCFFWPKKRSSPGRNNY